MSEQAKSKYSIIIKESDGNGNNIYFQKEYENEKDFYKNLKKNRKKDIIGSIINKDSEEPVYFIRSKAVFSDGNSTLCIDNKGKILEENKYEILKGKDKILENENKMLENKDKETSENENGIPKDKNKILEEKFEALKNKYKYIVKKDENSYYRYSNDRYLIDSVEKIKGTNNYTYCAYGNDGKEKIKTEITSAENIDEAIKLTRGQIKIKKEIHGIQSDSKIEEELYNKIAYYGIYPNGNELNQTFFGIRQYEIIKKICKNNNVSIINEKGKESCDTSFLMEKLALQLAGKEDKNTLTGDDKFKAKKFILEELFKEYDYKLVRASNYTGELEKFKKEDVNNILKNNESVDIVFLDKSTGEEIFRPTIKPMRFFSKTNLFGIDKANKITKCGKNIEDGGHFFVKPVGKPMYLFKKEKSGEFSNHSNFEYKGDRKAETSGLLLIKDGKINNISNSSGHFRQSFESIMTGLAYMASQTKDCNIENLLDPSCRTEDGSYKILTDINEAMQYRTTQHKQNNNIISFEQSILDVTKPLTKEQIKAINIKAARMKAKEASKGGLSI